MESIWEMESLGTIAGIWVSIWELEKPSADHTAGLAAGVIGGAAIGSEF
jgi:hypothetical protein